MTYKEHDLTLNEDALLGAFGQEDRNRDRWTLLKDEVDPHRPTTEDISVTAKRLQAKGLIDINIRPDGATEYLLTRKGKALWKVRNAEEAAPLPSSVRRRYPK